MTQEGARVCGDSEESGGRRHVDGSNESISRSTPTATRLRSPGRSRAIRVSSRRPGPRQHESVEEATKT